MAAIHVSKDLHELNHFAAELFVALVKKIPGRFTVALAGGSTPKALYRLLASDEFRDRIDWPKVFFFFGDERCVPPDHPDSNYRMAKENLFDLLEIGPKNIVRWPAETTRPEEAAAIYENALKDFFSNDSLPRFDLVLLGLGADGHTASLFPFSPALKEASRIAVANPVEKFAANRLTLTFPVINHAANVIFLVSGAEKAGALKEVLEGAPNPDKYPAQMVKPVNGNLLWLIDEPANGQRTADHDQTGN